MKFYRFTAKYWTDYDMDMNTAETQGLVVAESYADALTKLERRLSHLEDVYLKEWGGDTDFIFVDEENSGALDALLEGVDD